jgi:hypothetical protein
MRRAILATLSFTAASAGLISSAACTLVDPAPGATVDFLIDAPLCSSRIPVEFAIDGTIVGTDTFLVHLGTVEHTRSRAFTASSGQHTLHAATGLYAWPDKTLTFVGGQSVTDTLPFYCS